MIRYQIRSVSLLNVVNDIKSGRLVPDAYFQRNLVWREVHKHDFIDTILKGYPFPQMFFSRGKIDLERMETTSCIVDGQQRSNAIMEFLENKFPCNGRHFRDLSDAEKSNFFKYEIGVIELDIANDAPEVKEIFKRLNRTSTSLTTIEKLASEFGASEYMLVAKLLTNQLVLADDADNDLKIDPLVTAQFKAWATEVMPRAYPKYLSDSRVFTDQEVARKVPLFHTLNLISSVLSGYFNRNEQTLEFLDLYKEEFEKKGQIVSAIEQTATVLTELKLKDTVLWKQKAVFFTLLVEITSLIYEGKSVDVEKTASNLQVFENSLPEEFLAASREGVNNKKERITRGSYISKLIVMR
jgi:hypothetical protein